MRLTAENKAKVRRRILDGAAGMLRKKGYDNVNLDQLMAGAGLTRGAFYAHFGSKSELFAEIARHEHPLLHRLRARTGETPEGLWTQMLDIFRGYLDPANLALVFGGCTFASLSGDVSRAPQPVRHAYAEAWQDIRDEMARGQAGCDLSLIGAGLVLATGAVSTAAACGDANMQDEILRSAFGGFEALMAQARAHGGTLA